MLIKEFRIVLPLTVDEYQVAQPFSLAEVSKSETGGGEGIEVRENVPYEDENGKGQYTHKIYHLQSKVPKWVQKMAPKGSLEFHEKAWNAYPYCKTIITMPKYMKEKFELRLDTWHKPGRGEIENVHNLSPEKLHKRKVDFIDIADNDHVESRDYKIEFDPTKFKSEKTGRGPLTVGQWQAEADPVMCCYKLVTCNFVWFGLQTIVEEFIMKTERRLFTTFHRQVFCEIDKYIDLTMDDIRKIEEDTKKALDEQLANGPVRGTIDHSDDKKPKSEDKKTKSK